MSFNLTVTLTRDRSTASYAFKGSSISPYSCVPRRASRPKRSLLKELGPHDKYGSRYFGTGENGKKYQYFYCTNTQLFPSTRIKLKLKRTISIYREDSEDIQQFRFAYPVLFPWGFTDQGKALLLHLSHNPPSDTVKISSIPTSLVEIS